VELRSAERQLYSRQRMGGRPQCVVLLALSPSHGKRPKVIPFTGDLQATAVDVTPVRRYSNRPILTDTGPSESPQGHIQTGYVKKLALR